MTESVDLRHAIDTLTDVVKGLREDIRGLVRQDVYDSDERLRTLAIKTVADDVADLKEELKRSNDRRAADRRLIVSAFIAPFVLLVIQLVIAAQTGGLPS